jgi:chromosome segregation ATPase
MVTRSVEVDMKLDSLKKCVDELYDKSEETAENINSLNDITDYLDNQVDQKQISIEKLEDSIISMQSNILTLTNRVDVLSQSLTHFQNAVIKLEKHLQAEIVNFEKQRKNSIQKELEEIIEKSEKRVFFICFAIISLASGFVGFVLGKL